MDGSGAAFYYMAAVGLAISVPAALSASRLVKSFLFETQPNDPSITTAPALRAQSHTDSNLADLPRDVVRHRSVEPHARDQEEARTAKPVHNFANVTSRLIVRFDFRSLCDHVCDGYA